MQTKINLQNAGIIFLLSLLIAPLLVLLDVTGLSLVASCFFLGAIIGYKWPILVIEYEDKKAR